MKTSRTSSIVAAIVAIFSMLFMQVAVASYVCPGVPMGSLNEGASVKTAMAEMPNCDGMDPAQSTLCHLYAVGEPPAQSLAKTPVPDVGPFVPAILIMELRIFNIALIPDSNPFVPIALTRTTAPPIAIRNCCFRI
ncbi:MAG: hypothetical protein V4723_06425 [Pseudomonadota bacterium]